MTANEKTPGTTKVGPYSIPNKTGGKAPGSESPTGTGPRDSERQKVVTDKYRKGWDAVFGNKKR